MPSWRKLTPFLELISCGTDTGPREGEAAPGLWLPLADECALLSLSSLSPDCLVTPADLAEAGRGDKAAGRGDKGRVMAVAASAPFVPPEMTVDPTVYAGAVLLLAFVKAAVLGVATAAAVFATLLPEPTYRAIT